MNDECSTRSKAANLTRALLASSALMGVALMPGGAMAEGPSFTEALLGGTATANIRLRYEHVDQDGFSERADAKTIRARLGYETGMYAHFKALIEGEFVTNLGAEDYNDTTNGKLTHPVIADPNEVQLNRAQITYTGITDTAIIVGRQRVILDNARFVGNVGWRQNEQTFDAAVVSTSFIPDTTLTYGYVDQINRVFGRDHPLGTMDTNTHLINANYKGIPGVSLTAYSYLLDVDQVSALSSATYGLRATGKTDVAEGVTIDGAAEYARQSDYAGNTANFDLDYYRGDAGVSYSGAKLGIGYEVLEGNGTTGFATPLATLHAFNGWADVFLATPATGLEDRFVSLGYGLPDMLGLSKINAAVIYHDFEAETSGASLGDEWDAVLSAAVNENISLTTKYATYDGPTGGPADRDKVWFQVEFNY